MRETDIRKYKAFRPKCEGFRIESVRFADILRNRNLTLLNVATFISFFGRTMQRMLLGWWVLELTNSPYLLGIVSSLNVLPMAFSVAGGIVVDRFDRRKILILSELLGVVTSLSLAGTILTGLFQFWQLPVTALLSGFAFVFGFSARSAMVPDLAGKKSVVRAMSVQMIFWNSAFILGPYMGGVLLNLIGYGGCFALLGAAYLIELMVLALLPPSQPPAEEQDSILRGLVEGAKYIRGNQGILGVLLMAAFWNLFVTPFQATLLPILARNVLAVDAIGLGVLTGSSGVGSLLGSLILIGLKEFKHSGWMAIVSSTLVAILLMLFSTSHSFALSQILLILIGCVNAIINTMSQTPLLVHAADDKRGLVMGLRGQAIATLPLGSFIIGYEASSIGAPFTVALNGSIYGLIMIGLAMLLPRFRGLE